MLTASGLLQDGSVLSDIAPNQLLRSSDRQVPTVVIGEELNGPGVRRSLGIGGMPVWVVDCKRSNPALWSRCAYPVLIDTPHGPGLYASCAIFRAGSARRPSWS
jgi:hypothetical protein